MRKFKVYRAIAIISLLLSVLINFQPFQLSQAWINMRSVILMITGLLYFVCFGSLISVFNFYKDSIWKKFSVVFFIIGNFIYNFLFAFLAVQQIAYSFILLIFYLPVALAFVTIKHKNIKPLAVSFGYIMFIVCLLHIVAPFARSKIDLSPYALFFNGAFLLPIVLMIGLFHKMIFISVQEENEVLKSEDDLL